MHRQPDKEIVSTYFVPIRYGRPQIIDLIIALWIQIKRAVSFGMIRGGKIAMSILGAMEVAENGDLANWKSPNAPKASAKKKCAPQPKPQSSTK